MKRENTSLTEQEKTLKEKVEGARLMLEGINIYHPYWDARSIAEALTALEERVKEVEYDNLSLDFWKEIVVKDGELDIEQVKKELHDYGVLLDSVGRVYDNVTGGKVSKPNTDPDVVIALAEDYLQECIEDEIENRKEAPDATK